VEKKYAADRHTEKAHYALTLRKEYTVPWCITGRDGYD